jgi:hypothetical protein
MPREGGNAGSRSARLENFLSLFKRSGKSRLCSRAVRSNKATIVCQTSGGREDKARKARQRRLGYAFVDDNEPWKDEFLGIRMIENRRSY